MDERRDSAIEIPHSCRCDRWVSLHLFPACTHASIVALLYTRQGWRSQGTGPSFDLAPPHRHEPIGATKQWCYWGRIVYQGTRPRGNVNPLFRTRPRECQCLAAIPVPGSVRSFLPAGAEVPSPLVAFTADPNSLSTSLPQIRSAQGCCPEQTTTRTRTGTSTISSPICFFGVFGTLSSIPSSSISHFRPRLLLCPPAAAATNHELHAPATRPPLTCLVTSLAQPPQEPNQVSFRPNTAPTSIAQSSPSQNLVLGLSKNHRADFAHPVLSCRSLLLAWNLAAQPQQSR